MRQIDVQITKGQIESFAVTLKDNIPDVSAQVSLFTADGKKISTFTIGTQGYHDSKFELPLEMIQPILQIADRLERIVILECNRKLGRLEAPKEVKQVEIPAKVDEKDGSFIIPEQTENVETPLGEQIDGGSELLDNA